MVRGPLEPLPADSNKATCSLDSLEAKDACSDTSDSDLYLYSAWDHHADHLFEAVPVAEPRCYLSAGSLDPPFEGAPPQACVYTTSTSKTPPPTISASKQPIETNEHHLYCTNTDTSRSSSRSSCSLSSSNSKSPLNRNSSQKSDAGNLRLGASLPGRRLLFLLTSWRRRQATGQHLKMLLKRRTLLLAGTCLLLISCTIASLAITRKVSQRRLTERQAELHHITPAESSTSTEELEFRSLELVDLIECGKTFAAIKTRLEVQVPRSTPIHHQRPSYLNQSPQTPANQQAVSSASEAHFVLVETKSNQDPQDEVIALDSQEHLRGVEELKAELNSTREDLPPLVAQANTPMARMLALDADAPDPVEDARKAMHLNQDSYNRTLVECFFVDTDKRFDQRVTLEDRYRLIASTRSVPLKHMIAALVDCRHVDWKKAPLPVIEATSQQPQTTASKRAEVSALPSTGEQEPPASHRQQLDLISSLVASILRNEPTNNRLKLSLGTQDASDDSINKVTSDTRRGSYSSMGLSMVSGIVPNTLWCGLGDRAANYSQLGPEYRVDSCCRAHDHCPIRLKPLTGDYGLFNWSVSTRSHCDCDQDFNQCLRQINSTLSSVIRTLYFRLIGTHCIAVNSGDVTTR